VHHKLHLRNLRIMTAQLNLAHRPPPRRMAFSGPASRARLPPALPLVALPLTLLLDSPLPLPGTFPASPVTSPTCLETAASPLLGPGELSSWSRRPGCAAAPPCPSRLLMTPLSGLLSLPMRSWAWVSCLWTKLCPPTRLPLSRRLVSLLLLCKLLCWRLNQFSCPMSLLLLPA
jgi:hypothetical protein